VQGVQREPGGVAARRALVEYVPGGERRGQQSLELLRASDLVARDAYRVQRGGDAGGGFLELSRERRRRQLLADAGHARHETQETLGVGQASECFRFFRGCVFLRFLRRLVRRFLRRFVRGGRIVAFPGMS
jgi:hypothetical protein